MRPRVRAMSRNLVILPLLWVAGAVGAQDKDEGVFEPGVRHVCVPNADGEGWDCGTEAQPPANYQPPQPDPSESVEAERVADSAAAEPAAAADVAADGEQTPPPPLFLMDPDRNTPYAPVEATTSEPTTAAEAVIATESAAPAQAEPVAAVEPEPAAPVVHVPQAGIDGSVSETAGRAELVAAPGATPAPDPLPAETPPATEVSSPAPSSVPATVSVATLADADAFSRLPATAFTLQLAYAGSAAGFPRLVAELGLDPASCYVLRVRGAQGATWLLAHGAYADVAAARAAQAALPKVAGLSAQWPRRIGALQTEITQGL